MRKIDIIISLVTITAGQRQFGMKDVCLEVADNKQWCNLRLSDKVLWKD